MSAAGEPTIRVGLVEGAPALQLHLEGRFVVGGDPAPAGEYVVASDAGGVVLRGATQARGGAVRLSPADFEMGRLTLHGVTIGKDFHWQRSESQVFQGAIECRADRKGLTVVNELPLESYLASVISSEMRASCPPELLRAHAIVSRSWLLAQLAGEPRPAATPARGVPTGIAGEDGEICRWYDRESHAAFHVCADDHCQRYQGISRAFSPTVFEAVRATRGVALVSGDEICDARYAKCCGGMTEVFPTAWDEREVDYLQAVYDGPGAPTGFEPPSRGPAAAERWILGAPPAHCSRSDPAFLAQVLPGYDQETVDFFRWTVVYRQEELAEMLQQRLGCELGRVAALEPLERGPSGRIRRLRIRGERGTLVVGKELEIRRALSRSHLYSSAFVARGEDPDSDGFPRRFRLGGAGWGHGVGLCQIGAAAMAAGGSGHEQILAHYFRGTRLRSVY
jgi:peptidoglycan hydrolase-like amidase